MRNDGEASADELGGEPSVKRGRPTQETPLSLLERLRADDAAAWRRLVDLYRPLVLFWCARGGVSTEDAEDVAQGVFAAAATGLGSFRRDRAGDTFRGWLRAVTRNQILLHFRRSRGHVQAAGGSDAWRSLQDVAERPDVEDDGGEETEVGQVYRRAVEQVRSEFEDRTWQAFWLVAIEGRAPADLIETLDMSPAAIRQAKSRVLRRLKHEMGELLD
jgi:RNA polymerase sigma-70 factor (ECF subfamily)